MCVAKIHKLIAVVVKRSYNGATQTQARIVTAAIQER